MQFRYFNYLFGCMCQREICVVFNCLSKLGFSRPYLALMCHIHIPRFSVSVDCTRYPRYYPGTLCSVLASILHLSTQALIWCPYLAAVFRETADIIARTNTVCIEDKLIPIRQRLIVSVSIGLCR